MNNKCLYYLKTLTLFFIITVIFSPNIFAQSNLNIFGYFSSRLEKSLNVPQYEDGEIESESEDFEWQNPYFNLMFSYKMSDKLKVFGSLNGGDGLNLNSIEVRNLWAELNLLSSLKLRIGKSYRKFGLYNEILDAVPTYYAIEPPQYLNSDHPVSMLYPRLTQVQLFGGTNIDKAHLSYSLSIDKGISESYEEAFPFGTDINLSFENPLGNSKIGFAFYTTAGDIRNEEEDDFGGGDDDDEGEEDDDDAESAEEEEEGLGIGSGTLPWMKFDNYNVIGVYLEHSMGDLTIQGAYYTASHQSTRDVELLEESLESVHNENHLNRFLIDPDDGIEDDNLITSVDYDIITWYVRAGYSFYTDIGEVAPYVQWDYYKNAELVGLGRLDEEHNGMPDNGEFMLATIGLLYRPEPNFVIKFDMSNHMYDFYGEAQSYPEFRLDFSFIFGN